MPNLSMPALPDPLTGQIERWTSLKRWERIELAQELRSFGLSYSEISALIPSSRSSLSKWCRDVELGWEQKARLDGLSGGKPGQRKGAEANRKKRQAREDAIRARAPDEVASRESCPLWLAGLMLYWAEGSKTSHVCFTNSDPAMIAIAVRWFRECLGISEDRFTLRLHLHSGQSETEAMDFWRTACRLPNAQFGKTYVKPEGSGHRKNVLYQGTIQVVIQRSGDLLIQILAWIEGWYHAASGRWRNGSASDS